MEQVVVDVQKLWSKQDEDAPMFQKSELAVESSCKQGQKRRLPPLSSTGGPVAVATSAGDERPPKKRRKRPCFADILSHVRGANAIRLWNKAILSSQLAHIVARRKDRRRLRKEKQRKIEALANLMPGRVRVSPSDRSSLASIRFRRQSLHLPWWAVPESLQKTEWPRGLAQAEAEVLQKINAIGSKIQENVAKGETPHVEDWTALSRFLDTLPLEEAAQKRCRRHIAGIQLQVADPKSKRAPISELRILLRFVAFKLNKRAVSN